MAYALEIVFEQRIDTCRDDRSRKEYDPHESHSVRPGSIAEKQARDTGRCELNDDHHGYGDRECIADDV